MTDHLYLLTTFLYWSHVASKWSYVINMSTCIVTIYLKGLLIRKGLITGFLTRLTRRVPLVEQELLTLPEHQSSPPVFSGVRVTRSLVLYVCFVDRCLSFCTFSFGHCVVCSSSICGFWLPPFGIFKLFLVYIILIM